MLAFTMQFSKHERTPTHNHHQHPRKNQEMRYGGRTGPHARTCPTNQADQIPSGLKTPTHETERLVCPFPQDPTVCSQPRPPDLDVSHSRILPGGAAPSSSRPT